MTSAHRRLFFAALLPLTQACDKATSSEADAGPASIELPGPADTRSSALPSASTPGSNPTTSPQIPPSPTATQPSTVQPTATQPAATQPAATQPAATQPTATATSPSPSDPPESEGTGGSGGTGDSGGAGGVEGTAGNGGTPAGARDAGTGEGGSGGVSNEPDDGCPGSGNISYSLSRAENPTQQQRDAYDRITSAMDEAVRYYNCYGTANKELRVVFEPSVPTADGNVNGSLRFGSTASMNYITAMHEIAHTLGVGGPGWSQLIVGGAYQGPRALATLRELTGDPNAELRGDGQHFWPYGLNYTHEVESEEDLLRHCLIVMAIREDLGLQ